MPEGSHGSILWIIQVRVRRTASRKLDYGNALRRPIALYGMDVTASNPVYAAVFLGQRAGQARILTEDLRVADLNICNQVDTHRRATIYETGESAWFATGVALGPGPTIPGTRDTPVSKDTGVSGRPSFSEQYRNKRELRNWP